MADPEQAMDAVEGADVEVEDADDDVADEEKKPMDARSYLPLMRDPRLLAAFQSKLNSLIGQSSMYISNLPKPVKRRLKALKNLQLDCTKIEARFYEEVHELECRYAKLYEPLLAKRAQVTTGAHEPKDEECEWPSDDEKDEEEEGNLSEEMKVKAKISDEAGGDATNGEDVKGVPEFWLTVFKNVEMLAEMIQEYDEPILKHLKDVQVKFSEKPMGFLLEFHFDANDYFTNTLLTKEYEMKCAPDTDDPFSFDGPEIIKCKGCHIDWKKGKNVTVKTIKKKQKHKSRGSVRTITKTVQNDSFFNFFDPPTVQEDPETEVDDDTQALLAADFEIGHFIRERIVPRAVLYFTGEALEEDYGDEEGDEEDEEDDEEDEDNDPDYNPAAKNAKNAKTAGGAQNATECKQQ